MTRRIERAMALLRRGDLSVTEVCFAVGCSSLGTFSTRFTELVGVPPSVYRRRRRRDGGDAVVRGETGDQTDQESRSAGQGAAPSVTAMDITIHSSFFRTTTPDASLAFFRDVLGFEVRNDVGYGGDAAGSRSAPPTSPTTSIVLHPPACRPRYHRGRAPHQPRADGQGQLLRRQSWPPTDLDGSLREAGGRRRRGRPGADRAAVRRPRLRLPRPAGNMIRIQQLR
jgi:catechol 2,3-dioxygenase-like lactoylglutathione lyase family enzyme